MRSSQDYRARERFNLEVLAGAAREYAYRCLEELISAEARARRIHESEAARVAVLELVSELRRELMRALAQAAGAERNLEACIEEARAAQLAELGPSRELS